MVSHELAATGRLLRDASYAGPGPVSPKYVDRAGKNSTVSAYW